MTKIKLTVTESQCRSGYFKKGDSFIVEDCVPRCATNCGMWLIHMYLHCKTEAVWTKAIKK